MNKIDTTNWDNFKIKDIFETEINKNKIQVPTGANVKRTELKDGNEARITVSGINNGIIGYYSSESENYRLYENFISVSFLSTVFYHPYKASLDMKVHCLKPKNIELNKYTGLFLVSVIRKSLLNYSYSDQISSSLLPELSIKLPYIINESGKKMPDFEYMENYIKELSEKKNQDYFYFFK